MNEEMDKKIGSYLRGRFTAEEAALFEKKIAEDKELRKEVDLQRIEMAARERLVKEDLLKNIAIWEEEDSKNKNPQNNPQLPWWKNLKNWIVIGLFSAIIFFIGFQLYNLNEKSNAIEKEKIIRKEQESSKGPQVQNEEATESEISIGVIEDKGLSSAETTVQTLKSSYIIAIILVVVLFLNYLSITIYSGQKQSSNLRRLFKGFNLALLFFTIVLFLYISLKHTQLNHNQIFQKQGFINSNQKDTILHK